MKILGIDPGTLRTGVGLIESQADRYQLIHCEIIFNRASLSMAERLKKIYCSISELIKTYRPDAAAIENIYYGRDPQALIKIGEARACAMLAASEQGVPVIEYAPARVKKAVAGNGQATKEQIQYMVKLLLNLKESPPTDASDALAVAICHFHSGRGSGRVLAASQPR